ncbi:MAG: LamG domain-containing protein, partial [Alphaproteobacteria bacterium]|nr:LamG domain-containing protein [Alphaproteobacteria bacterium]
MPSEHLQIFGYADQISAAPGETIRFMVSCEGASRYRADLVRIVNGDMNPDGPGYREVVVRTPINRMHQGRRQDTYCGSYGIVPPRHRLDALNSFTVQAVIWPTTPDKGEQAIIAKWDAPRRRGFQLLLDRRGALAVRIGDGGGRTSTLSTGSAVLAREWYVVGASYDAATHELRVWQEAYQHFPRSDSAAVAARTTRLKTAATPATPLTFAAIVRRMRGARRQTALHFNGKID